MDSDPAVRSGGLEDHEQFGDLLAELSSRFINLEPSEVDREIEVGLRRVCEHLGVDLAVLWQWSRHTPEVISPTHAYPPVTAVLPPEPLREEQFPWIRQSILDGRVVVLSSLGDLPPESHVDREFLLHYGIKSHLCIPLSVGGESPVGLIGFNTLGAERDWPDAVVKQLQLVAQVFANALARRRHELSLQESEERLALAADAAEAGLWTLDFRTGVFWVTARARAIFGYPPDGAVTIEDFRASVHPDDWNGIRVALEQSARAGEPVNVEYRIVRPVDGRERWVASRGRSYVSASGGPERLMGVSTDITDRKRADEALRVSEARLLSGADLAGLAFYEVDFEKGAVWVDDRFRDLCGVPDEWIGGLRPLEFWIAHLHPDDRQRVMDARQHLHDGQVDPLLVEYRFLHPLRGEIWVHHQGRIDRHDAAGRAVKTFGVLRDITTRKQADEALRASFAEIERLKDRLQAERDYLKAEINVVHAAGEVTGQSAAIRKVLRLVEQVAPTGSAVLIQGETGTGKELVAQAIHRLSPRGRQVMVKVNCAALPSGLVESELFGREKGAFTGALTRQVGRFEVADGSTIFLDEVGELPADVQVKLLRVLQEGEFERLGSPRTIKVNVRVIAATNRDLAEEVRKGRFREDLFYRLNVFPIRVPPLRERPEDIPLLVWALLEDSSLPDGEEGDPGAARDDGGAPALSVAGQRPRTAERPRARGHHHHGRHAQIADAGRRRARCDAVEDAGRSRPRAYSSRARAHGLAHQGAEGRSRRARAESRHPVQPHEEAGDPAASAD